MIYTLPNLQPILPEIILALGAMSVLMFGVFDRRSPMGLSTGLSVVVLALAAGVLARLGVARVSIFDDGFVTDGFAVYAKELTYLSAAVAMIMSTRFMLREGVDRFEVPVLMLLAVLGMGMMISANDLMALYVGLELQSLSLYVVAAIKRDSEKSTEAGLKYFVLGALSSGLLLYGATLIYGFSGTTNFNAIAVQIANGPPPLGVVFGLVFLLAGLAFKISAVPFHMWTPDVYEGAPTPITNFFAGAPKIAAMCLLIRLVFTSFPGIVHQWQQIIIAISICSMVLGSFAAIGQTNIKRLMAYSSISNMGFALVGLAAGTQEGVQSVLIYLAIYLAMTLGSFACIMGMRRDGTYLEEIADLAGLWRRHRPMAIAFSLLMFSLAGIPPLAGFFAKLYVFLAAIQAGLYILAVIAVLASVVGAVYYLTVIKVMLFDEPAPGFEAMSGELRAVLTVSILFLVLFAVYPSPLIAAAEAAARSLIP